MHMECLLDECGERWRDGYWKTESEQREKVTIYAVWK